jgi:hypothetical protein
MGAMPLVPNVWSDWDAVGDEGSTRVRLTKMVELLGRRTLLAPSALARVLHWRTITKHASAFVRLMAR